MQAMEAKLVNWPAAHPPGKGGSACVCSMHCGASLQDFPKTVSATEFRSVATRHWESLCPSGQGGGLKIHCRQLRVGSNPTGDICLLPSRVPGRVLAQFFAASLDNEGA